MEVAEKCNKCIIKENLLPETAGAGIPRPAALPTPGPTAPGMGTRGNPSSGGGGPEIKRIYINHLKLQSFIKILPSTVKETIFSPRNSTNPRTLFSSLSGSLVFFCLIFLNSSQSPNIKFMCLSNALNVPINVLES